MIATLRYASRLVASRLGVTGALALALLLPSVTLLCWAPQWQHDGQVLRSALAERTAAAARERPAPGKPATDGEPLRGFMAQFPPLSRNAGDLEKVFALAKQHTVELPKGQYQLKADAGSPLLSYTATFAVRNEYGALKAFAADVLQALPHVSMDELRLSRNDAGSGALDATLRFTFVYGGP